ncbi:MAG: hypothetical protein R3297_00635 [Desulfobulbales bacterium]|nr:hypothetical protein [Desulfobulbales bacterium]
MRFVRGVGVILTALLLSLSSVAQAEVVKGTSKTFDLESKPIDMAVSADGKTTFVLVEGGKILIYDQYGTLKDTLKVSDSVMSIGTSPNGDSLLLADSKAKTLEVLGISFVVDIDVTGLPFKGPANAPVVIAVFSDYQ